MLNILPFLFFGICVYLFIRVADGIRKDWSEERIFVYTTAIFACCFLYVIAGVCHFEVLI